MKKNEGNLSYRFYKGLLYGLVIYIIFCNILRLCGIYLFYQEDNGYKFTEIQYYIISSTLKILEGFIILKILTDLKWWKCLIFAVVYDLAEYTFLGNDIIYFILDILFIFCVPLVFNKDEDKSMIKSFCLIIDLSSSLLKTNGTQNVVNDVLWSTLGLLDYKLFLVIILMIRIKREEIKMNSGDKRNSFLFWGVSTELLILTGLCIVFIITLLLCWFTPCYIIFKKVKNDIPKQRIKLDEEKWKRRKQKSGK